MLKNVSNSSVIILGEYFFPNRIDTASPNCDLFVPIAISMVIYRDEYLVIALGPYA